MKFLQANFQIVTPMFLGDANQEPSGLRPPSIKGALRFWWRALNWGRCLTETGRDEVRALRLLHEQEAALFGIAADENDTHGQSKFLLKVRSGASAPAYKKPSEGHQYLLGQGLFKPDKYGGELLRQSLELSDFTLKLVFKPGTSLQERRSIAEATLIWGLLGGLGSRSRKGFGSVAIHSLDGGDDWGEPHLKVPQNARELGEVLQSLLAHLPSDLPPFTAFSETSRIDFSLSGTNPLDLLSRTGDEMQFYRSNGRGGVVRGKPASPTFRPDHDLAQNAAAGILVPTHPRRVVFGVPHNYYFSSTRDKLEVSGNGNNRDRRASPLLIHVHRFPQGGCVIVQSLLPAQFLPRNDRLTLKGRRTQSVPHSVDWSVLHDYLNLFVTKFAARQVI